MDRRYNRRSRWEQAELIVKLTVALAGAGYTVAQMIEILQHVHW